MKNSPQKSAKNDQVSSAGLGIATFGVVVVTMGGVIFLMLTGVMALSRTFDSLLFAPLALIALGLVCIKLSGVTMKKALPKIIENIIGMFFPFV